MTHSNTRLLAGSSLVALLVTFSSAAIAQTQPTTGPSQQDTSSADQAPDVVVTGSRIRSPNLDSLPPTVTIGRQYIEERNLTNVADVLNELPGFRGSVTPNGAQGSFGQGVNFVNGYGLGSNRTLVLVNGRRFVTSNVATLFNQGSAGTQVDLNVINSLLTDRVDVVSIGGAPIYGSDAIAGTVNIILKDRYKGVDIRATAGVTERGDGFRYSIATLAGHDFADGRANLTLAYQHDRQNGILYNDRDFLRENLGGATNPTTAQAAALGRAAGITVLNDGRVNTGFGFNDSPTDGFPGTVQVRDLSIYYLNRGGVITSATGNPAAALNYQFDPSGNLVSYNKGILFPGINASGGDGFRFNDYSQITSQLSRDIFNGFAHFDVSDALKFFVEGEYFYSRGDELVQQPTFNSNLFGGTSGALTFTNTSPFLTAQAKAQLAALGVTRFQVSRASNDLADLTGYSQTYLLRGVFGARGDFTVGGRHFNYEASVNRGRTLIIDHGQDLNAQHFINAVNVTTDGGGNIVCTATPTVQAAPGGTPVVDAACVPLNVLGYGRSSQAARDYVIQQNSTRSVLEEAVGNVNVGGSPFDLFGNNVGFNIGFEHREERGTFTPSAFQQAGLGRSVAIAPLGGKYVVNEEFGEVNLPIVTERNGLSFLNRLEITASGRHVNNSINGGFNAWSVGGILAPIHDITFRGNYTKSFRGPAITELFLPVSNAFSTVPDLCSPANINGGSVPLIRKANCTAFLAKYPNATPLDAASATVPSQSGGNSALKNEISSSFTYGILLQPRFIPGLTISADYIDINIVNPIANLSVTQVVGGCFDNPNFNVADPANGNFFCSLIKRYATGQGGTAVNGGDRGGQVINDSLSPGVRTGFVNGVRTFFSGIQGSVDYRTRLTGLGLPGMVDISSNFLFVRRRIVDITGVAPQRTDGTFGDPKFSGQVNVRYLGEVFSESTSINIVGQQSAVRTALSPDLREFNMIKAYATVNQSISINVDKKFKLNLAVTNLFDRIGQQYFGSYPVALINDFQGRRFSISVDTKF